ncbi:N-acetyltransferase [Odoribacter sp. OttesenSCG-928-J03]|nr:N-acetyltransferase [Odoribacter sp. OttesenSCG-928-J03]MDL2283162.1 N-acetyltransferase [Odoribacter sp. OttesenSCG-928-G04]MDL2331206.1 N-acetyltransferase [Odoribacter sp. OttesenSCG-928-A06]
MIHSVQHLGDDSEFRLTIDGETASVVYEIMGSQMAILHTIVPVPLQNKGVGSALIKAALDYCQQSNLRVDPVCPFAKAYIARHREYQHLSVQ